MSLPPKAATRAAAEGAGQCPPTEPRLSSPDPCREDTLAARGGRETQG
jgi:hypothetical protein